MTIRSSLAEKPRTGDLKPQENRAKNKKGLPTGRPNHLSFPFRLIFLLSHHFEFELVLHLLVKVQYGNIIPHFLDLRLEGDPPSVNIESSFL